MNKMIGIVGAGTMGAGIMINSVVNGYSVVLTDRNADVLEKAKSHLEAYLARQVKKDRMSPNEAAQISIHLHSSTSLRTLSNCSLIIEAVFEDLDLKKNIFEELEALVSNETILASNTSCLKLSDIASGLKHRQRFCGLHYFSPAEINPVVELIELPETTPYVLASAEEFLSSCGKEIISCRDQSGFALNRFFCPYTNEAVRCLDDGLATTGQIDKVARDIFGTALGPFAVMNIIGTRTNLNAVRNLAQLGPYYGAAEGLVAKGEANADWAIEEAIAPLPSQTASEIADRLVGSILLPVFEELEEGTATLTEIETGALLAFRFERTPGQLIQEIGQANCNDLVKKLARKHGHAPTMFEAAA